MNTALNASYINNVGGGLIELLIQISLDERLLQKVAARMRIAETDVTSILKAVLEKVDSGQLTDAELALIMTAPVADETPGRGKSA